MPMYEYGAQGWVIDHNAGPVTSESVFDAIVLKTSSVHVDRVFLMDSSLPDYSEYAGSAFAGLGRQVGEVRPPDSEIDRYDHFLEDDPEVIEVSRRVRADLVKVFYFHSGARRVSTEDEMVHHHWDQMLMHPFDRFDRDEFIFQMVKGMRYRFPTAREPQRFSFPGVLEGATKRYYKRQDNAATPDVGAAVDLVTAGWQDTVPYGSHQLHAVDVFESPEAFSVSNRQRIYHRRKSETDAIVAIARKWNRYWRGLTSSEQGINTRMTARKHFEHAIGRVWAGKPNNRSINVFYEGNLRAAPERPARDAEDWMLGNLEQWAHDWGFAEFALAINTGSRRSILETRLRDHEFCLIKRNGDIGDILKNPGEGITLTTWDGWQDTHYPAAVRHGVDAMTVPAASVSVQAGQSATVQMEVSGGLAPYSYSISGETWASIDDNGLVTVAPDAAIAANDYDLTVTVTDDLGSTVTATVTVTVTAA